MVRALLLMLIAALPVCAAAQNGPNGFSELSDAPSVATQAAPPLTTATAPHSEKGPVGAVTFGYIYLASETAPGGPWNWHLHGFYGIPQFNVKPWMAIFADFTQSYNTSRGAHENVQAKLGGFLFTAKAKAKISPFGFGDAGFIRDSMNGTVAESPAFAVGGGFTYKLNKHASLLLIPGEYVRTYATAGNLNNFTSRVGLVVPLYR